MLLQIWCFYLINTLTSSEQQSLDTVVRRLLLDYVLKKVLENSFLFETIDKK